MQFTASKRQTIRRTLTRAQQLAQPEHALVIYGETGAGKEHLARALHEVSPRASHPFIAINVEEIPEGVLESELFGHEEGAFTGANSRKRGVCERVGKGTLLIDEFHRMPDSVRDKLLRLTAEHVYHPVGSEEEKVFRGRFMFAMNEHPKRLMNSGKLSRDMYHRIATFVIGIPPLRKRREDILPIVHAYLEAKGRSEVSLHEKDMQFIHTYDFPGNVRQLHNFVDHALIFQTGDTISIRDACVEIEGSDEPETYPDGATEAETQTMQLQRDCGLVCRLNGLTLKQAVQKAETEFARHALEETGGNVTQAAKRLDVSRETLRRILKR